MKMDKETAARIDDFAWSLLNMIDPAQRTESRETYYDGYASGLISAVSKIRHYIREIVPDVDQ